MEVHSKEVYLSLGFALEVRNLLLIFKIWDKAYAFAHVHLL